MDVVRRPSSNLRVSFLESQINRYNLGRCGLVQHNLSPDIPDVLEAPGNKVNPRPRCRTSVANDGNPRVCDLICNVPCVCVRSRFRWCYTRGHMTQYHNTAAGSRVLHWDASCATQIVVYYCLLRFHAVRHNTIPLRW